MNMTEGYTENSNDEEHKYDNIGRNHSHLEDYIEKI